MVTFNFRHRKEESREINGDIMNIIKYICLIIGLSLITSCSICPWKTIKFISFPVEEFEDLKRDDISENNDKSDCTIENVFFYFVSNGIEDSMYCTKAPYSINFIFESFDRNTVITINSILIEFDGRKQLLDSRAFPIDVSIATEGYLNSKLYFGNYETDYVYDIQNVHEISVTVNATILKDGCAITKNLRSKAMRQEKRGVFQYRY